MPELEGYDLRARFYRPEDGRFLSQDPYQGDLADPASLARYAYAQANPAAMHDPMGRRAWTLWGVLADFVMWQGVQKRVNSGYEINDEIMANVYGAGGAGGYAASILLALGHNRVLEKSARMFLTSMDGRLAGGFVGEVSRASGRGDSASPAGPNDAQFFVLTGTQAMASEVERAVESANQIFAEVGRTLATEEPGWWYAWDTNDLHTGSIKALLL
ncbi:MAG: RHS repeat-associated core domain-containing protein, partial [Sumerlaeia bacterium]